MNGIKNRDTYDPKQDGGRSECLRVLRPARRNPVAAVALP